MRRVNNCVLGILANVKLPATSEYLTLSTKYYVYELIWNIPFELNDEWRKCGVSRNTAPAAPAPNIGLSVMKKDRIDVLRYENRYT